ncbi:MAG TPA: YciI family protein [Flavitalea sp.]|nr:YciI family protein [Flavitalea sp.]
MKEFALLFRQPDYDYSKAGPEKMKELGKKWNDWVSGIVAQGKLGSNGVRLAMEGKVLKAGGVITDGPFVEIKEKLGSFIIVKAESLDEATTLAHGCPAIDEKGSVEIRPLFN